MSSLLIGGHPGSRLPCRKSSPRATGPLKRRAVACYRSQLRALSTPGRPGFADVFATEGYWRLVR